MSTPDPEQKPAPEIRGGDRPSDYMPEYGTDWYASDGMPPGTFEDSEIEHPDHYEDADDDQPGS